jgi:dTMP kinase
MKGLFITIEGNDGSGKSTVITSLKEQLAKLNVEVCYTREPGGSYVAEKIREVILDNDNIAMDDKTEALLYAASRRQHLKETVFPALEAGKLVICDRFIDSSLTYQGIARGLGVDEVYNMNMFATEGFMPHLTIYLLVDPKIGLERKSHQKELDRLEHEKLEFHQKVYNGYLMLADRFKDRVKIVNGNVTIEEECKAVNDIILNFIKERGF